MDGNDSAGDGMAFGRPGISPRWTSCSKEGVGTEKKLAEVLELPFDEIVRIELRAIVEQIRSLNKSIAELEKTSGEEGSKLDGYRNLASIKGIGKITGAILLSVIGSVDDFADEGHLASYFGIVPRVSNSNETEHSGRIHKRGTKLGRTALVQSALIAANYSPYLKRFDEQVKARRGAGKLSSRWPESFWVSSTDAEERVGVWGISQLRIGKGVMKALWNPP
jgi:transposase